MQQIYTAQIKSPLGYLSIFCNEEGLYDINFDEVAKKEKNIAQNALVKKASKQLEEYFQGTRKKFDLPMSFLFGTPFQQKVWQVIAAIPFGEVITYTELAKAAGRPKAIRAAASACGKNPLPIIIPCHRVLGKSGLGGYTGGLHIKRYLLEKEGIEYSE